MVAISFYLLEYKDIYGILLWAASIYHKYLIFYLGGENRYGVDNILELIVTNCPTSIFGHEYRKQSFNSLFCLLFQLPKVDQCLTQSIQISILLSLASFI